MKTIHSMIRSSNWDEEVITLRESIKFRLNEASRAIVEEEVLKILGRVRIFKSVDLKDMQYNWFIEPEKEQSK
jgi:hypothetical protein